MHDEVRLVMPADPEFLRLARVTAMGLASRLSFTIDEIDDLRIAIDELVFGLIGSRGRAGTVALHYSLRDKGLEVAGSAAFDDVNVSSPGLSELSQLILDAVTDEHSIASNGDGSPSFRFVKLRSET